jgi:hypothetical protein
MNYNDNLQAGVMSVADMYAFFRGAFTELAQNYKSTTEPNPTFARMWWPDETTGLLKQRNADNTAWIVRGYLDKPFFGLVSYMGSGDSVSPIITGRNKVINPNFDIWQRGTSLAANGSSINRYLADRWISYGAGSTIQPQRQAFMVGQIDVPNEPQYFHRFVVGSISGSANCAVMNQLIEGVRTLSGKTVTLSFWAKALNDSKPISVEFTQIFGFGGSPSATVTGIGVTKINLTATWQKFIITTSIPSISGKTIGANNNDCLQMSFWFDAGSNFNTRTASLGQQSGTFDIAQVQLEEGSIATNFEYQPRQQELALCQRYYETGGAQIYSGPVTSGVIYYAPKTFYKVNKRVSPTVTLTNSTALSFPTTVGTFWDNSVDGFIENRTANVTGNGYFASSWTADAEL